MRFMSSSVPTVSIPRSHRTSLILDGNIGRHAAIVCAEEGISKKQYIEKLIEEDLRSRGIDPTEPPLRRFPKR
jgi:hypothetical protein